MDRHKERAIAHIKAVQAASLALQDEYSKPRHDRATIADINANVSRGLKLAEVEAVLAVAEELEKIRTGTKAGVTM